VSDRIAWTIPQYGQCADPAVVETVETYWREAARAREQILAFAKKYGSGDDPGAFAGIRMGWYTADGIYGKPSGHGQWKRQGRGWAPYKSNPIHQEFAATSVKLPTIPGLPAIVMAEDYFMEPRPIAVDGVAFYGLGHMPRPETCVPPDGLGSWTEILTSEYHRAKESWIAARRSVEGGAR
jgi:hypothetical protein